MQVGIFTGYFPYALEETAQQDPGARLQHRAARPALQGHRLLAPEAITADKAKRDPRDASATTTCRSAASRATPTSSIPIRASGKQRLDQLKAIIRHARASRLALRDLRDRHLQHRQRLGRTTPRTRPRKGFEECRKVIRELAQVAYDHGAVFLLETYVNNVVGSVEETVRMFAEVDHPGLGLLMDPTNYFEAHNIDRHGRGAEAGLRHPLGQDPHRARQGRQARRAPTSPRSTPTSATRTRRGPHLPRRRRRSSCRRRASAR